MTTFQDPPHQSRRAVRRSEVRPDEQTEVDAPARPATARTGRRAQLPSATEWQDGDGTEAKPTRSASPMIEPFTLATHSVPQMPTYTPASHSAPLDPDRVERPRPAPGRRVSLAAGEAAPTSAIPVISLDTPTPDAPAQVSAPEESSPAAEAIAETSTETASTETASTETATVDAVNADTVDTPVVAEQTVPADDVVANEVAAPVEPVVERTMTRRELREMRVAAERAAGLEVPEAIGAILNSGTIILPYLSSGPTRRVEEANAEFDALTQAPANESADPEFPVAPVSTWDMPLESPHHADSTVDDGTASSAPALIEPPQAAPVSPPTGRVDEDDDDAVDESDQVTVVDASTPAAGTTGPTIVEPATSPTSTRSAGHWSVRADMDEDIESLENTLTRTVGSTGAITTSALVLPSVPQSSDITSPFTASGETMVTGSIDLPRSLGASGVHPGRVDTSDFDLDPLDREVPTTDSAPVRAIRAVSTHTSSNGMVTSKKPQGNRMLTGMVVLASTMAVGVAGLLIAGFALQLFP
jgi:hypothetical protein